MFNSAVLFAKHHTPNQARVLARRAMLEAHNVKLRVTVPVEARTEFTNVYHCAIRKTASQWVKAVFSDPLVFRHSGLLTYDPRYYNWSHPNLCPPGRVALSLFIARDRFDQVEKPARHRAFYVLRDPRDLVVSSYFSNRDSHSPMGDVLQIRRVLQEKPKKEGLIYLIEDLAAKGRFNSLQSWVNAPESDEVRLFRYEDLTGEHQEREVAALMRHCGIHIPPDDLATLLARYSFSRMNDRQGAGAVSHYRKGEPGDWRNHFDDDIQEAFTKATGNLVDRLGYPAYQH
ncbi:sulfotransferase domain-containing protein [Actinoplanes sp. NPDC049596]|uniref:sulfotransferase domain-containing protein n=1 Tax=unclassified Actinoplanes TaxID=2626549 RepID=UPI0034398136